jgi:site-specific DNA-methyltransferase (adenine-specific)
MSDKAVNDLYYGDNLDILQERIGDESVDLIYLDPPFNSARDYNILFASPRGGESEAQIVAFKDSWQWGEQAEKECEEIVHGGNTHVAEMILAMRRFLGENDMMAYLVMMARRLVELHRVLKPTGSLYLHCDPTASHYLKIVLDGVFGKENFQSEIIWRRTGSHNKAGRWAPIHDTIFFFTKSARFLWKHPTRPYMKGHVEANFARDETGLFKTAYYGNVLTGSGKRDGESGQPWRGFDPSAKGRHWAIPGKIWREVDMDTQGLSQHEKLDLLFEKGFIKIEPGAAWPVYERTIMAGDGPATPDIWAFQPYTEGTVFNSTRGIDADVSWLKPQDEERLGYPTQKPLGLLERIIAASSNEGDVILDPFCGCGTAVYAAQKLGRRWTGIDITHLAIALIEKRIKDAFPGIAFDVHGTPRDLEGARDLANRDKYQFQWWACSLVNAQPFQGKKKGADGGIDGIIYFQDEPKAHKKIVVSVKGGENINVAMIRDLAHVVEREKAAIGLFVTLAPPGKPMLSEALREGYYTSPVTGGSFPKLQILSIEDLLNGSRRALYPDLSQGAITFKKTKAEQKKIKQGKLF